MFRRYLPVIAIAAAAIFADWQFTRLAGAQAPRIYFDSQAYFQIAARPFDLAQLFYAKPLFVPLVYRLAGSDPSAIRALQIALALIAWTTFAFALARVLRRTWLRAIAVGVAIAFLLAAPRIGWTAAMLSESIDDSLLALLVAGALLLVRARSRGIAIATGAIGVAWIVTRDTNAITALAAIALAAIVWPVRRWWRGGLALAAVALVSSIVALASTRVPESLPFQSYWDPAMTSRAVYPTIDNLVVRVLATDRAWLVERGAPVADLERFRDPDKLVANAPDTAVARAFVLDRGGSTYARWFFRHPIDRALEFGSDWVTVLSARHAQTMPVGWVSYDRDHVAFELLRRVTTNRWLVLALVLATPIMVFRPRRDPRRGLALVIVASGLIGAIAAYFGDAVELARHCYGSGQQLVVGAFVALLIALDRDRRHVS